MDRERRRLLEEHRVSLRPDAWEMRMTLCDEIDATGGRVALEVGGALNSSHVPGESEANVGVGWRPLWESGALRSSSGSCMHRRPGNCLQDSGHGKPRRIRTMTPPRSCRAALSIPSVAIGTQRVSALRHRDSGRQAPAALVYRSGEGSSGYARPVR